VRRVAQLIVVTSCVCVLVLTGCSTKKATEKRDTTPRGGTLRVVMPRDISSISSANPPTPALDPQTETGAESGELFRCCLLRTLLSNSGHSTEEGGAEIRPDLAAKLPEVSADGLTWTFTLKRGIRYSPPLQTVEVTSADFIRGFRREARLGDPGYLGVFSVIRGFDDYAARKSDTISGLEAPDASTLLIRLTQPTGDLAYRLLSSVTSPIPPLASDPGAPFGVATGHDKDGYGAYLVATGPYMIEGSDKLDFSRPPGEQPKLSGLATGKLISLVRNPSWSPASDDLRAGYADRIEIRFPAGDGSAVARLTTTGMADVDLDFRSPTLATLTLAQKVRADPALGQVHVNSSDFVRFISMNLAMPPFDDLHVRRAVNYAVDKAQIIQIIGGPLAGRIAGHVAFDSMENNLLVAYDPYKTAGAHGDLSLAKQEIAKSAYDKNHDGVCDVAACRDVLGLVLPAARIPLAAAEIARDLIPIGIHVRVKVERPDTLFPQLADPTTHVPLTLAIGVGGVFLNASNLMGGAFSSSSIGSSGLNYGLLGASAAQLRKWGYQVSSVPRIDDRIKQCLGVVGSSQIQCWASLDQYIMEQVVPWVPLLFLTTVVITPPRVVAFSFDQLQGEPALDRIALRPGS
jgi:ABC-type transport system substrate-binding protein